MGIQSWVHSQRLEAILFQTFTSHPCMFFIYAIKGEILINSKREILPFTKYSNPHHPKLSYSSYDLCLQMQPCIDLKMKSYQQEHMNCACYTKLHLQMLFHVDCLNALIKVGNNCGCKESACSKECLSAISRSKQVKRLRRMGKYSIEIKIPG